MKSRIESIEQQKLDLITQNEQKSNSFEQIKKSFEERYKLICQENIELKQQMNSVRFTNDQENSKNNKLNDQLMFLKQKLREVQEDNLNLKN